MKVISTQSAFAIIFEDIEEDLTMLSMAIDKIKEQREAGDNAKFIVFPKGKQSKEIMQRNRTVIQGALESGQDIVTISGSVEKLLEVEKALRAVFNKYGDVDSLVTPAISTMNKILPR